MDSYFNFDEDDFFNDNFINEIEKHFEEIIKSFFHEFEQTNPIEVDFDENFDQADEEEILEESETDAAVFYVPADYLPHGRFWRSLGIYVPDNHAIYIANDLHPKLKKFVYYHEVAHSLGIMDEKEADMFATKKCGFYINLRRPKWFAFNY